MSGQFIRSASSTTWLASEQEWACTTGRGLLFSMVHDGSLECIVAFRILHPNEDEKLNCSFRGKSGFERRIQNREMSIFEKPFIFRQVAATNASQIERFGIIILTYSHIMRRSLLS